MSQTKTAFVFAGGGSLGAVQVGMLTALTEAGLKPDLIVGSSVGALNAGFFAGDPTAEGVAKLAAIWRSLRRRDIFRVSLRGALGMLGSSEAVFDPGGLRRLIEGSLSYANLEDAPTPIHVVATSLAGETVRLSSGPAVQAIMASAAIPAVFPTVEIGEARLMDGAVSGNTPILTAVELGADRLIVLPTGFACAPDETPMGALARGFHALTLLIAHQMVRDLALLKGQVQVHTVPSLCPLTVSPFDFGHTQSLIDRAADVARRWLDSGGLERQQTPGELIAHSH